jgi:hypothetical protein
VGALAPKASVDVYAFTGHSDPTATVASLPPAVDGVSWIFGWKDIETAPGVFDWSSVDAAIAASANSGRKTMVRIDAGAFSPAWVPNQLTIHFQPQGPQPPQTITMPRPWDPTYISDWTAFIRAYGARYDGDARLTRVQMTGGGWQGEMALPQWPGWTGVGYTDQLMVATWETFIDSFRSAFPRHQSALDIGEPLTVYTHSHVLPTVLAYAAKYGSAVAYQQNGLTNTTSSAGPVFQILHGLSADTDVGWQMWGGGDGPAYLYAAFGTAIASDASYVEVYLVDCTNPADAGAIAYLRNDGS